MRRYSLLYPDGHRVIGSLRELCPLWSIDWDWECPILEPQSKRGTKWTMMRGNGLSIRGWQRLAHRYGYVGSNSHVPTEWAIRREPVAKLAEFFTGIMVELRRRNKNN